MMALEQRGRRAPLLCAALATVAATIGVASCKEPTQITLSIRTDALCKSEQFLAPRLNDVAIVAAEKLDPTSLVPTGTTESCDAPADRAAPDAAAYVGSLVLVPDAARKGSQVDVLVVAGVENDNPKAVDQSRSMSAAACLDLLAAGTPITGTACIVARRNVGFVDNLPLVLPIELERDCIGKECGEDQTCFHGNCVSSTLDCAKADAAKPDCQPIGACQEPCDKACGSALGTCVDGTCTCSACDPDVCAAACGTQGSEGVCSADASECSCVAPCDQPACTTACDGQCAAQGPDCECPTCDPQSCDASNCPSGMATCSPTCTCVNTSCDAVTLNCSTGQVEKDENGSCVCRCDATACTADCIAGNADGGACDADQCSCFACPQPPSCLNSWQAPGACVDGAWSCDCDATGCSEFCATTNQLGQCTADLSDCTCSDPSGTGGGAQGGMGVGGMTSTTTSTSSSMGGMGGMPTTTSNTGGFTGSGGSTTTTTTSTGMSMCSNAECANQLGASCSGSQGQCPGGVEPCECTSCDCPMDCTAFCQTCEISGGLGAMCTTSPTCACNCDSATCNADCLAAGTIGGACGSAQVGSCQCSCNGPSDCAALCAGPAQCLAGQCLCQNPMLCSSFQTFPDAVSCAGMCPAFCMAQPGCSTGTCNGANCTCSNQ